MYCIVLGIIQVAARGLHIPNVKHVINIEILEGIIL